MVIKMVSMILGGGRGSRLFPLTEQRSKPAVPIGGKYRLIDIPISNCLNSGVKRMFVLTQFNSASLNQHIKNTYNFDMFSHGFVDILAAEQTNNSPDWYQGTADAVRQCMHHLWNHEYDYILILSGDQLYQMNFEEMAKYHILSKADVTIATIPVTAEDATGFGIMQVNKSGFIERFTEKPALEEQKGWESDVSSENFAKGKVYLASMGIYIFSKKAVKNLFKELPDATDFGKEIIPSAITNKYKVASYQYDGYWEDIGTIKSFFEANIALTDDIPEFNLFDNEYLIYTRPRMLAPSKISNTRIKDSIIAEACILLGESIEKSVVGIRSKVDNGSVVNRTVLMGNDYFEALDEDLPEEFMQIPLGIGKGCHIEHAIIDKNTRVGDNVKIIGHPSLENEEHDAYYIVDGIIVTRKGATIPSGTHIGYKE